MVDHKLFFSVGLGLVLSVMAGASQADWAESKEVFIVRPAPVDRQIQAQNPPAFAWAQYPGTTAPPSYVVEVLKNGVVFATYTAKRTFYLPTTAFGAGQYSWRVRPSTNTDWSTPRTFTIDSSSQAFEVPDNELIRSKVLAHPRPRQQRADFLPLSAWTPALRTARGAALTRLTAQVTSLMPGGARALAAPSDSLWPVTSSTPSAARTAYVTQISQAIGSATNQMLGAALLYQLTGESKYLQEALARGNQLAVLDPEGMTSYVNHDMATRSIMLTLAKCADLLSVELNKDPQRKALWMAAISARVNPMYADLIKNNYRLDQTPFDAHGVIALGYLAVISTLTMGDIPAATTWFDFSFRSYVNAVYAWSGPEGGYANGTSYAMFNTEYALQLWQPMAEATGVNIFTKPWSNGFARYLMHFLPPGAPGQVFGDQHEGDIYNFVLKGFVSRFKTPQAAWYVKNIVGEEADLTLFQAPYPLPVETVTATPVPPPNAALYPTIGWVAMHSNLADRARTSVYFKSSPYGSYNHGHGDQNALVIDSGGRRLLIESGYEDYYYSPLVMSWYRQTKSHNAITFNNGVGQLINDNVNNLSRNGKITAFSTTPTLDYAAGDATPAYGGALTSAVRKVWYLRGQDAVVVVDRLSAPTALSFEWNLHAAGPIAKESATAVKITKVDRTLCITSLGGEANSYQPRSGPPPAPGKTEDHGAFVKTSVAQTGEFIVLLDVGCKRPKTTLTTTATGKQLMVGTQAIMIPN